MRFHMLQNVQMALDFLRYRKIKLVNIRSEDVVDGNHKYDIILRDKAFDEYARKWALMRRFLLKSHEFFHLPIIEKSQLNTKNFFHLH